MESTGSRKREYDSSGRRERARLRRLEVLRAAVALMSEDGYVATTMASIAHRAGTSVEFVYQQFGDKATVASHALDFAVHDGEPSDSDAMRLEIRRMIDEPDARDVISLYSRFVSQINIRSGALIIAFGAAAPTDERVAELSRAALAGRFAGARALVLNVAGKAELRTSRRRAIDSTWAVVAPELHRLLVRDRGWSDGDYEEWIADHLEHDLSGVASSS